MANLIYRLEAGRKLTNAEVDGNFRALNTELGVTTQTANNAASAAQQAQQSADGKQQSSPKLTALASAVWSANNLFMATGSNSVGMAATTPVGLSILNTPSLSVLRADMGAMRAPHAPVVDTTTSWNDIRTPDFYPAVLGSGNPFGPQLGAIDFWYCIVFRYSESVTQVAIPYGTSNSGMIGFRSQLNGNWTSWRGTITDAHFSAWALDFITSSNATAARQKIGLANVDNTSDANKPVSTAVQSALSFKADKQFLSDIGLTGNLARPLPSDDFNQAKTAGWWSGASGSAVNAPPGLSFPLVHVVEIGGYVIQDARDLFSGRRSARAFNITSGVWSNWQREAFLADLGTAAFAALATSDLDTTVGRVVRIGDHGVGGDVPYLNTPNLNALTVPNGDYFVAAATNSPASYGFLTYRKRSDVEYQRIVSLDTAALRTFERTKLGGTAWGGWVETTPFGAGQLWYNLTPNRNIGVNYRNAVGRPIQIAGLFGPTSSPNVSVYVNILGPDGSSNAITVRGGYSAAAGNYIETPEILIPQDCYYNIAIGNGTAAIIEWREMR